jgi:hypothetical protein
LTGLERERYETLSSLAPPDIVSLPAPPSSELPPGPPTSVSLPKPPERSLKTVPAISVSLPARPWSVALVAPLRSSMSPALPPITPIVDTTWSPSDASPSFAPPPIVTATGELLVW